MDSFVGSNTNYKSIRSVSNQNWLALIWFSIILNSVLFLQRLQNSRSWIKLTDAVIVGQIKNKTKRLLAWTWRNNTLSHQLLAHTLEDFSGCLENKAVNNFRHFTFPNTTNYSVVLFSQTGSLILSQQLLHSDIALSLSLPSSTPMPIVTSAAFWHKTAHYLPRGRLNSLPVSAQLSSCDQTATKLQSGVAPLLLNPLTWCPLQSTAILSTKTWTERNFSIWCPPLQNA